MMKAVRITLAMVVLLAVSMGIFMRTTAHAAIPAIDNNNLGNGLWYAPNVKIYSAGTNWYVAEVSTYPRAYKDTSSHSYLTNTAFTVTAEDINAAYNSVSMNRSGSALTNGTPVFMDSRHFAWTQGQTATRYAGDPLPGEFPLWIESEALAWSDTNSTWDFDLTKLPLIIENLQAVYYFDGMGWTQIKGALLTNIQGQFTSRNIATPKLIGNDRMVVRLLYQGVIRYK